MHKQSVLVSPNPFSSLALQGNLIDQMNWLGDMVMVVVHAGQRFIVLNF
jgi:hypothetical protein